MRTSITHPLRVDWLPLEGDKGCIGMTLCPGKYQPVAQTGSWDRQLALDVETLVEYNTDLLVSLITDEDMEVLRVTDLPHVVNANGIDWAHLPFADSTAPTTEWLEQAEPVFNRILTSITEGERVVVHCMGGLSRAGTFVAIYLYRRGLTMEEAIERTSKYALCLSKSEKQCVQQGLSHLHELTKLFLGPENIDYTAYGFQLWLKHILSRKSAENLFPKVLA